MGYAMNDLYVDGACEPTNPGGYLAYGWHLTPSEGEADRSSCIAYGYGAFGRTRGTTNNMAEYAALIQGLSACLKLGVVPASILGDSQLVVNQVKGVWKCKSARLARYLRTSRRLLCQINAEWSNLRQIPIGHIPRDENAFADRLSRLGISRGRDRTDNATVHTMSVDSNWLSRRGEFQAESLLDDLINNP